jgi:hypothetical protein
MIDVQQLREVFQDKLAKTGNLDDAFIKAVWVAYQQGLEDALEQPNTNVMYNQTPVQYTNGLKDGTN